MPTLKEEILGLQVKNFESKWYIPGKELEQLFSHAVIEEAIKNCGIEAYKREEVVQVILKGAKKIFAVLVLMVHESSIQSFIEQDHLQDGPLDAKIPFQRFALDKILDQHLAEEFYRTQWTVAAPLLRDDLSHRLLEDDIILPFSKTKRLGCGAFGVVYEIVLDARHQGVWKDGQVPTDLSLVRKEIDLSDAYQNSRLETGPYHARDQELHVLSLLRLIRHPNIVHLVASYSYRGTYNLLFHKASGDLAAFLLTPERPPGFQSDDSIVLALQGLAEAVAALHEFLAPEFGIRLKGYHHDLKPENVLVGNATFLLSDFGLSNLKEVTAKSKTLFKDVVGYYIAPECETVEDGFQKNLVGQPSDIWSLGCIMAVVITYMLMGASGVQEFEKRRKRRVMDWTTYQFHSNGRLHPAVDNWLSGFEKGEDRTGAEFCRIIRALLQPDPHLRPNAQQVVASMNLLVARHLYRSVDQKFQTLSEILNDVCISIEEVRLTMFARAVGLDIVYLDWNRQQGSPTEPISDFGQFKDCFLDLLQVLDAVITAPDLMQTIRFAHRRLRSLLDRIWNTLSPEVKIACDKAFQRTITSTEDVEALRKIEAACKEQSEYRNVGLLAAIKYMTKLAEENRTHDSKLKCAPEMAISLGSDVTPQASMAKLSCQGHSCDKEVLIEWMEYDDRWRDEVGQELFVRVEAIAKLLHSPEKPAGFRSLRCMNYYHNRARHAFGLIFELPTLVNLVTDHVAPCTLLTLIETIRDQGQRPSLGDLFQLAKVLTTCVHEWHNGGWLHKRISSSNIVVFPQAYDSPAESIGQPYIIGFNHSRPDKESAFSLGPPTNPAEVDYCHPQYLTDGFGYRREYDYYSLGLVLLEIGLWRSIRSLSTRFTDDDQRPENLRDFLLEQYVSRLHSTMGKIFQNAVRTCLNFCRNEESGKGDSPARDALETFEAMVLLPIGSCFA